MVRPILLGVRKDLAHLPLITQADLIRDDIEIVEKAGILMNIEDLEIIVETYVAGLVNKGRYLVYSENKRKINGKEIMYGTKSIVPIESIKLYTILEVYLI